MGEVFHAVHLETGANVAIKVVSRTFIGDVLMARLEREAAAATRIQSPFIPRMLEVDRTGVGEGDELFLVMELLHGESLSERLKRNGGMLGWDEARLIGDNVLQALIAAHAAGVVHRDLKPGNIFIETMPAELGSDRQVPIRARILDFGVCKLDGAVEGEKLTVTGESVGTIAYMAPEQIRGASKVDERADLYSFAMVVFEMVCGRLAYDAAGQMALLASKLERHARSLSSTVQIPVPSGLDPLINKALSRDPEGRQPNAREVLDAWRALGPATNNPVSLPIVTQSGITINPPTQTVLSSGAAPPNGGRASRSSLVIAIAAIVASLLVGVSAMRRGGHTTEAAPAGDNIGAVTADLVSPAEPGPVTPVTPATPGDPGDPAQPSGTTGVVMGPVEPVTPADYEIGDPPHVDLRARSGGRPRTQKPAVVRKSSGSGPAIIEQPHY
jgi:serine/threonine-protein kinase